jgi:hypothetical protein
MTERIVLWANRSATWFEQLLALAILVGAIVFAFHGVIELTGSDWSSTETFYDLMYRVLLLVIAVELIRTLVTHDLNAILELLAFVVARKMLKPDLTTLDIILCSAAFAGLLAAKRFLILPLQSDKKDQSGRGKV